MIKTSPAPGERIRVEGPTNSPHVRIGTLDGRWVALHSPRNPRGEAAAWLESAGPADRAPAVVVVIGAGAGYVLDDLQARWPTCPIVVLEPESLLSEVCRRRRDFSTSIAAGRLRWLTGPDYVGAAELWRLFDRHAGDVLTLEHPVLVREYPEDVARARAIVQRARFDARANAEARRLFAGPYLLNTLENLPTIVGSGDVGALAGLGRGHAALLVAAGPSLDQTLDDVRHRRDRAMVIAVDTALRPLLSAGIDPDLVVAVDPAALNARHLRDLPGGCESWLVAEGSLHPTAFTAFADRTFTFKVSPHNPWPWLQRLGLDRGTLRAWGSVLTSAFDLGLLLGCDPLVFVGADLAYTGGRPYCRGTTFETDWGAAVAAGASLPALWAAGLQAKAVLDVEDLHGASTRTGPHLMAFRDWLVEQASICGRRVVNASGQGIFSGQRLELLSLERALADSACVGPQAFAARLAQAHREAVDRRRRHVETFREISADSEALDSALASWNGVLTPQQLADLRRILPSRLSQFSFPDPRPVRHGGGRPKPDSEGMPHLPERAALLHSARHGVASPAWVSRTLDPSATARWLRQAAGHVERALRELHDGAVTGHVDLTEALGSFDASLAAALSSAPEPATWPVDWPTHLRPVLDHTLSDGLPVDNSLNEAFVEVEARVRLWLKTSLALLGNDSLTISVPRRVDTILGLGCGALLTRDDTHTHEWREHTHPHVLAVAGVGRGSVLATVVRWGGRTPAATTPVRVLQREGLPPASYVSTLDDLSALVTVRRDRSTYRLDEAGRWTKLDEWPASIDAAVPLPGGGTLAWNIGERKALLRRPSHCAVIEDHLPFDASRVLIEPDGSALWSARTGGCWSWMPGTPPRLVVDVPPIQHVERDDLGLILAPVSLSETGVAQRVVLREGWRWRAEKGATEPLTLGAEGPCSSHARRGPAEARVYNIANLVRIEAAESWDLLVPEPLAVAWAGASLVVQVRGGDVLLFERLIERLGQMTSRPERA